MQFHPCLGAPVANSTAPHPILFFPWSGDCKGTSQLCPSLCLGQVTRALSVQWGCASWSQPGRPSSLSCHSQMGQRPRGPWSQAWPSGSLCPYYWLGGLSSYHQPGLPMGEAHVGGFLFEGSQGHKAPPRLPRPWKAPLAPPSGGPRGVWVSSRRLCSTPQVPHSPLLGSRAQKAVLLSLGQVGPAPAAPACGSYTKFGGGGPESQC
ncbi:hypothetical protein HJG60_010357 [Phyllostomus discolor]|uniref:Uncharacterized protein n=1 Tax=Phyllostomus discolor TaxID=89673 RepID=A0A834AZY9_9CHIR|nr:hypothetical protein HJG60_010357 [Phyllostomus discolor]